MRILHVTDRLSARGGADWHLGTVLAAQAEQHRVELAFGRSDGSVREPPCAVVAVPGLADGAAGATAVPHLERLLRLRPPDAIHVHNALGPAVIEWAAERGAVMTVQDHRCFCPGRGKLVPDQDAPDGGGVPCQDVLGAATCGRCFDEPAYGDRMLELTMRRLAGIRRMRAVTVLSRYMKRELVAGGVEARRITVIGPPVAGLDPAVEPAGPPCVLFAGRLARAKGTDDAVAAWRRADVGLPLVFAGTGPERGRLERCGFEVLGWVAHPAMAAVYRRARALLMPSRWQEPFGIVGIEALAMGVPVVAWRSGGVAEWHPAARDPSTAEAGAVVPWGDLDRLAAALRVAVRRPARRDPLLRLDGYRPGPLTEALLQRYPSGAAAMAAAPAPSPASSR